MGLKRVGIVGGGLGGLSAACTLAARGHEVSLYERNSWLGGKAAVLEKDGFRFDMGPTILTMPKVLRRIFAEAGKDPDAELPMVRLDPQWRCFFEDGARLDLVGNVESMAKSLDGFAGPGHGAAWKEFIGLSKQYHEITDRYFFWKAIGKLGDTFRLPGVSTVSLLQDLARISTGRTMGSTLARYMKDRRVFQMSEHFAQYVGSSPMLAPPVLTGIAHMQVDEGIWYPKGGIAAVPAALKKLGESLGVKYRTGARVRKIIVDKGAARGIETEDGRSERFDAVVSNMDSVRTHRELLGGRTASVFERRRSFEPACSGVVLYLGLDRRYDHLAHHNFAFSRDTAEEYDAIYTKGEPAPDPSCYVCCPSASDSTAAPKGGEALYILVHTPYLRDRHVWSEMLPMYRAKILEKMERTAGTKGIASRIVTEGFLTPVNIHERYSVLAGAIYGLASHGRFFGAFKPGNRSPDVKGLYLCGGAAHPGPGMPMVLMSGWIAADALDSDAK